MTRREKGQDNKVGKRQRSAGNCGRPWQQAIALRWPQQRPTRCGDTMPVTLAEVAAACRLSTSTVSRALSDPAKVNPQTRSRIERVAREMGYVPNRVARSLVSGRTD